MINLGGLTYNYLFAYEHSEQLYQVEKRVEEEVELEGWMAVPFDLSVAKEDPAMECWMAVPIKFCNIEDALELECCM